ncbi:MAG: dipeptidase [Rhodobacteraceae bacterium]|nr:dipeptidase [Paracoccaceae bacterium]
MTRADGTAAQPRIDGLQYARWSEKVFRQMRAGRVDAVHATICYHESFRETVETIVAWNRLFASHADLVFHGVAAADVDHARAQGRTAIFFGAQNPSCLDGDIGLIEVLHRLGLRFLQLTYNNQSLLGTGHAEAEDAGLTRMGREAVAEMNRLGVAIDMSHAGERTTLEAIAASTRPVTVSHANPASWHDVSRNVSDRVLDALRDSGGMLGFSLYPLHLKGGGACTLEAFCTMVARTAERIGVARLGIGSDLCQDQPDSVVEWMRNGRWTKRGAPAAFPDQPEWFRDNRDFDKLAAGLTAAGFDGEEVGMILGGNWRRFFADSFGPGR